MKTKEKRRFDGTPWHDKNSAQSMRRAKLGAPEDPGGDVLARDRQPDTVQYRVACLWLSPWCWDNAGEVLATALQRRQPGEGFPGLPTERIHGVDVSKRHGLRDDGDQAKARRD